MAVLLEAATLALAHPDPSVRESRHTYPFNQIVAFSDELSNNGNGSSAHGITGVPTNVYGLGTWTNAPVITSYLSKLLGLGPNSLQDYAFGSCCGGSPLGATIDNAYTMSPAGAASLVELVANYCCDAQAYASMKTTVPFIWIGKNDLSEHIDISTSTT
ncbi:MAG: hypothetical protein M1818_003394 [Claussenomyces sp. TS43310]|nr:MAG: hypothetical protein M1818_003394 [Claussenomyces sp. TS43310]